MPPTPLRPVVRALVLTLTLAAPSVWAGDPPPGKNKPDMRGMMTGQTPADSKKSVHYKDCAAVRKAGKAPLRRGQPGYGKHLDPDGDGIACP